MPPRHFLELTDLDPAELAALIERAGAFKRGAAQSNVFQGRVLALLFEHPSTRTRVAFEVAARRLGGSAIYLASANTQLERGEPPEDTARALSGMIDALAVRTGAHARLERYARASQVPIINALSHSRHPCQLLADMMTYQEHRGTVQGRLVAWVGAGNNVCNSYVNAACSFDFRLNIACPPEHCPDAALLAAAGERVRVCERAAEAVQGADLVVTDVWNSMGDPKSGQDRRELEPYRVTGQLMRLAADDALFMHCLPAHRGEEVTAEVIDGPWSVVWDEAANRLHTQQALLECLLTCRDAIPAE